MLNEVKHLLLLFPIPSIRKEKQILRRYTPQNDTGRKAALIGSSTVGVGSASETLNFEHLYTGRRKWK
jgi:hypothetical protein